MGEYLLPPDELNPGGYFQDAEFEGLVHEGVGRRWPAYPVEMTTATQIEELARKRAAEHQLWGVKSNRLIFCLDAFLRGAGRDVRVITTSRPRAASVASWKARVAPNHNAATAVIRRMAEAIPQALADHNLTSALTVDFDAMIENPVPAVEQIAEVCGVDVNRQAVEWINADWRRFIDG